LFGFQLVRRLPNSAGSSAEPTRGKGIKALSRGRGTAAAQSTCPLPSGSPRRAQRREEGFSWLRQRTLCSPTGYPRWGEPRCPTPPRWSMKTRHHPRRPAGKQLVGHHAATV